MPYSTRNYKHKKGKNETKKTNTYCLLKFLNLQVVSG